MRQQFDEELRGVTDQLVEMTRLVGSAISRASTSLLDADLTLAESVIHADDAVDALRAYFGRVPKNSTFGNGRVARKLFEAMVNNQASRLAVRPPSNSGSRPVAPCTRA